MAAIKQLAGQTLWYGVSSIGARFLNYLLTPLITYLLQDPSGVQDYGDYSLIYAWIALVNIVFTYGFETGYFRFANKAGTDRNSLFQTTFGSLLLSSLLLGSLLVIFRQPVAAFLGLDFPRYIVWCAALICLDAICTIPFARLRQEGRPRKYALIKLSGILVNIGLTVFFLVYLPRLADGFPGSLADRFYRGNSHVGFLIMANLLQNLFVFLLLAKEWRIFTFKIDPKLWKSVFVYSSPMILIGLAGMINEVLDRHFLATLLPMDEAGAKRIVGIYSANYKLSIFITLFIQAFRMAAEPFFFNNAAQKNAPALYARVMKWFVITMALAFLFTALFLDIWQYLIGEAYRSGLGIVPILLAANICLGMYYNLSIWYKLTDKMRMGLYITLAGTAVTLAGNYGFIPEYGMQAAAWSTFACYFTMMILAWALGQKYYPVPYPLGRIALYLGTMLGLYLLHNLSGAGLPAWANVLNGLIALAAFLLLVVRLERRELGSMPVIGKYLR